MISIYNVYHNVSCSNQKIFQRLDRTDDKKRVQQIFSILPPYINLSIYLRLCISVYLSKVNIRIDVNKR